MHTKINRPEFFVSNDTLSYISIDRVEKSTTLYWKKMAPGNGEKIEYAIESLEGAHTGYATIDNMVVAGSDQILTTVLRLPTGQLNTVKFKP